MMSEDYEDYSLPVFATSAEDFGRAQGDKGQWSTVLNIRYVALV